MLIVPHILGDLEPASSEYRRLEAHLLSCGVCLKEYEAFKETTRFIQSHRAEFAEVLESLEKEQTVEQEEVERSWKCIETKLTRIEGEEGSKQTAEFGLKLWKTKVPAAVAACLVTGLSVWLAMLGTEGRPTPQRIGRLEQQLKTEPGLNGGNAIAPLAIEVRTATDTQRLVIGGKHEIVMNSNTLISIDDFVKNRLPVCLVNLSMGEILAHVQPDGCPFVVSTPHGKAVVTGTTFDIRTTEDTTRLVVAKGSVRFESEEGSVDVATGEISQVVGRSAPTRPVLCDVAELTAWASRCDSTGVLTRTRPERASDLDDLWLTAISGLGDLEATDYKQWIRGKQSWFKREFPWIFQLKDALATEGIGVDYPELLVRTQDIWQFNFPESTPHQIPILNPESLARVAAHYGLDEKWLFKAVPEARVSAENAAEKGKVAGPSGLEKWVSYFEDVKRFSAQVDPPALRQSLHASAYLTNARTLAWLCVRNGLVPCRAEARTDLLDLLESQVKTAHNGILLITIRLMMAAQEPCSPEYIKLVEQMCENIEAIYNYERSVERVNGKEKL
jgi:ferric-dicitrate binding protein FerR (iron transport regulator)